MSCSDVMYQYYPYLYQTHRPPPPHPTHPHAAPHSHPHANPHAAHHSPARPAPFQPFPAATTTHQYDRSYNIECFFAATAVSVAVAQLLLKKERAKLSPNRREIEVNSPYRFKRKN
ncbi:hypothetical protein ALC53_05422 [Atta colombica]|uniref:Uncharacterized protein n=1 Tax=Atta colombica TaxID=520822 RepID=A0A195BJ15_9HYME|nr:hypothetical protein ALC53_05422 [Atta colombica]